MKRRNQTLMALCASLVPGQCINNLKCHLLGWDTLALLFPTGRTTTPYCLPTWPQKTTEFAVSGFGNTVEQGELATFDVQE